MLEQQERKARLNFTEGNEEREGGQPQPSQRRLSTNSVSSNHPSFSSFASVQLNSPFCGPQCHHSFWLLDFYRR
jgi:hypothetical protein